MCCAFFRRCGCVAIRRSFDNLFLCSSLRRRHGSATLKCWRRRTGDEIWVTNMVGWLVRLWCIPPGRDTSFSHNTIYHCSINFLHLVHYICFVHNRSPHPRSIYHVPQHVTFYKRHEYNIFELFLHVEYSNVQYCVHSGVAGRGHSNIIISNYLANQYIWIL